MPRRKKADDRARGSTRMQENGYHQVAVWFDPGEWRVIQAHCEKHKMAFATFVRKAALFEAEQGQVWYGR